MRQVEQKSETDFAALVVEWAAREMHANKTAWAAQAAIAAAEETPEAREVRLRKIQSVVSKMFQQLIKRGEDHNESLE